MPNLIQSIENLDEGITYLKKLLDNKKEIIEGFEVMSLKAKGHNNLFKIYINDTYKFLEESFAPLVFLLRNQINEGKVSKRKYNILLEDTLVNIKKDIFNDYLSDFVRLINDNGFRRGDEGYQSYDDLYDWLDMLSGYIVYNFKPVLKYGVEKENDEYYFLEGFKEEVKKNKKMKIDRRTLKNGLKADKLEFFVEGDSIKFYIKGNKKMYQQVSFLELDFLTIKGKPNKASKVFKDLIKGKVKITDSIKKQAEKINKTFKELLNIEDKIISSKDRNGFYKLELSYKQELDILKNEDVLVHHGRYISIPERSDSMMTYSTTPKITEGSAEEFLDIEGNISLDEYAKQEHSKKDPWYDENQ